jgi:uncharacterized repeat protein (TIGR04042 family)
MPERYLLVRWPDGPCQRIYSPSAVVEEYFAAGQTYPVAEFVERSREALLIAGERVKQAYDFPAGNASRSIALIEAHAEMFGLGDVTVVGIESPAPPDPAVVAVTPPPLL